MIPDHYPEILAETRESLPILMERYADPIRNSKGGFTQSLESNFRTLAVVGFLVERDVDLFRSSMTKATAYRVDLFDRFDSGDPIPRSLVSMMNYKHLLEALASGNIDAARNLSERMGGRAEIEREFDRNFEIAMGYALKAILEEDENLALSWVDKIEEACTSKDYLNFACYGPVLRAIVANDRVEIEAKFPALLAGHRRLSRGKGLFAGTGEEFLCVWGVGLLNLARSRGAFAQVIDPLVPINLVS